MMDFESLNTAKMEGILVRLKPEKDAFLSQLVKLPSFKIHHYIFFLFLAFLFLHSCQPSENQPNVLLIMVDDMGYGDMGLSGNPYLLTPNLDSLTQAGTHFTDFYVSAVCAPTRASLLTGRYHQRTGVRSVTNGFETISPEETTIAEILQANDYRTGIFGKWHLGEYYPSVPSAQGFDEFVGFRTGHTENYFDPVLEHNGKQEVFKGYISDILTDEALKFMEKGDRPFFCYLPYNAPHTPLQVDSQWFKPYLEKGLTDRVARVYGMMANLDFNIGRMINQLESKGILENTIVVFLSDNGPISGWKVPQKKMRFNSGFRDQKFTNYDGGIRTQTFWLWPKRWKSQQIEQLSGHIDVLLTLLDAIDIPIPDSLIIEGISLIPMIEQGKIDKERIFLQNYALETLLEPKPFPGGIARQGNWKMVNGTELYDLRNDRSEQYNLAEKHPEILKKLTSTYELWFKNIHLMRGFFPRPIPVGYQVENPVKIKPHHGMAEGNLQFLGKRGLEGERIGSHPTGVDGDWVGNWVEKGDLILWEVEIIEEQTYQLSLTARGKSENDSFSLQLSIDDREEIIQLPAISKGKEWQKIELVNLTLKKGVYRIKLALENKGEEDWLEIKSFDISF